MKIAIDGELAGRIDRYSIENGMPSMVLIERAAMRIAEKVMQQRVEKGTCNIAVVCSGGNNGADGLAAIRLLKAKEYGVHAYITGSIGHATEEFKAQLKLAKIFNIPVTEWNEDIHEDVFDVYDIIVDAMFGTGLSRNVEGECARLIDCINKSGKKVVAVDIPSGINSADGHIMGTAVKAECTVTFGYIKLGEMLYPGKEYAGELSVEDIGLLPYDFESNPPKIESRAQYFARGELVSSIPEREGQSNKGDYGKPLIIAGSEDMTGAAFMSAKAAYMTGAGVVTVITHCSADPYLKSVLPEAIVKSYDDEPEKVLENAVRKATVIVIGPGMSVSETSRRIVKYVLLNSKVPVIADADALNIISENTEEWLNSGEYRSYAYPLIVTPHVGEMSRLSGYTVSEIASNIPHYALEFAHKYRVYCVLKDAVSAVASPEGEVFLTTAGNPGMATAGCGDVLTGILAAVEAWKDIPLFKKLAMGVQIHGAAGDVAAIRSGQYSLMASHVIDSIPSVLTGRH